MVPKHMSQLSWGDTCYRQGRKFIFHKKFYGARLEAVLRLATAKLADEEELINMVGNWGMCVFVPVVDCRQFPHDDLVSRLFLHFTDGCRTGRIPNIRPTTR